MISNSAVNVQFRLNKGLKTEPNRMYSIYIRIRQGRTVDFNASLSTRLKPTDWNQEKQEVRNKAYLITRDIENQQLQEIKNHVILEASKLKIKGQSLTYKTAKRIYTSFFEVIPEKLDLFMFIDEFIEKANTKTHHLTGRPVSNRLLHLMKRL